MPSKDSKWIRISELEKRSGISRRTIHFYLQEGLLPPPFKTGRTMAYYDDTHLDRLRFIKKARKGGWPIAAIRDRLSDAGPTAAESASAPVLQAPQMPVPSSDQRMPQKEKSRQTRERILELGSRLFRTKGFKQTRISDITSAMNVGKGTFYFYFSDKTQLFLECAPRIFNELFAAGWDRIRNLDDPLERLQTRARLVIPVLREFCAILELSREAMEEADPNLRKMGEQVFRSIRRPISADIKRGIDRGIFREVDPEIASTLFIGVMESLNDLQRVDGKRSAAPAV